MRIQPKNIDMKQKVLLLTLLIAQASLSIHGQDARTEDSITVAYEMPKDDFLYKLMDFQKIYAFDVTVKSTEKGLPYSIDMVQCTDGEVTRKALTRNIPMRLDTLNHFHFFAQAASKDTAHIALFSHISTEWNIPIHTQNCILMEVLPPHAYATTDTIPLIAYTPGHQITTEWQGQTMKAIDYCGVRFSKKQPSEWYKAFDLKDYLYFELILSPRKKEAEQ